MNLLEYHKFMFLDDVEPYTNEELKSVILYFKQFTNNPAFDEEKLNDAIHYFKECII